MNLPHVFLDKYNIAFFTKKFKELKKPLDSVKISPFVWKDDFDKGVFGIKGIDDLLMLISSEGTKILIDPIPPCLIDQNPLTKKIIMNYDVTNMSNLPPEKHALGLEMLVRPQFKCEVALIQFSGEEDQAIKEKHLFKKCSSCKLLGKSCKGVISFNKEQKSFGIGYVCPPSAMHLLKGKKKPRMLDVGCSFFGIVYLPFLEKTNFEIYCIDPSVSSIESLKGWVTSNSLEKRVHPSVGIAEKLEFPDNFFDYVLMSSSLHHFQNSEKALKEAWRVLKKDGLLHVNDTINEFDSVPTADMISKKENDSLFVERKFNFHYKQYLFDEAKKIFEKSGFLIIHEREIKEKSGWHFVLKKP